MMNEKRAIEILIANAICNRKPSQCIECPMYSMNEYGESFYNCSEMLLNVEEAIRFFNPNYETCIKEGV